MALNYRADRSPQALFLSGCGAIAIMVSTLYTGGAMLYYVGTAVMLLGVWLNGSMLYFLKKLRHPQPRSASEVNHSFKADY